MDKVEITKFEPGTSYSAKEQTIILNVFKYLCAQNLDKSASEIGELTAKATGCSVESVLQFREEESMRHSTSSRIMKCDDTVKEAIRKIICVLKTENNGRNSAKMILKLLEVNPYFPKLSLNTLRTLLADMGYVHDGFVYVHIDDPPTPGRVRRKRVERKLQTESQSDDNSKTDVMENGTHVVNGVVDLNSGDTLAGSPPVLKKKRRWKRVERIYLQSDNTKSGIMENGAHVPNKTVDGFVDVNGGDTLTTPSVLKKKRQWKRVERIYPQIESQSDNIMENGTHVPNETVNGFVFVNSGDTLAIPPVIKKKRQWKRIERIYPQIESQSDDNMGNGTHVSDETATPLECEIKIEESFLDENYIFETEDVTKTELEIKTEDSFTES